MSGKHLRMEKDTNIMFWFSFSNCVKFVTEGDQKKNPLWKYRWILYLCRYCRKQITGRNAKVCNYVLSKPNVLNIFVKMVHVRQCWTRPVSSSPRTWGQSPRNQTALNLWKYMRITDRYLPDNKMLLCYRDLWGCNFFHVWYLRKHWTDKKNLVQFSNRRCRN